MGKKRELYLRVHGDRRDEIDTRRLARAIVRLAVELDADHAQELADTLEFEEALRRKAVTRRRKQHTADELDKKESA
jgi:hypothetical protein